MGAFDTDFTASDAMFAEAFGHTVTIKRGVKSTTGVMAEVVDYDYQNYESLSSKTVAQSRAFVINVGDYLFSSVLSTPQPGDEIYETIDGVVHVFEVVPSGTGPCCEWCGSTKPQWKIHTILAKTL